jgi:hypothetical protein
VENPVDKPLSDGGLPARFMPMTCFRWFFTAMVLWTT